MITVENIEKKYKTKLAVTNFNIELDTGLYGLIGPNGAGKSTLMNIMAGILNPTKGRILYNGVDIKKCGKTYRKILGYLPQNVGFYPEFTAKQTLAYFANLNNITKPNINIYIEELLDLVNLKNDMNKKVKNYSGGMKQRLGIAIVLVKEPQFLIFDEPTVGLDPKERLNFKNIISRISKDKTIILSTHIVTDVENIAQNVIFIDNGKKLYSGSCENVISNINNKVWSAIVNEEDFEAINSQYYVTNIERTIDGKFSVVIFSNEMPNIICQSKKPTLEDAYMYSFR